MKACALALLLAAASTVAGAAPLTDAQALAMAVKIKTTATDIAYGRCLASTEVTRQSGFSLNVHDVIANLTAGLSFGDRKRVTRSAFDLPASVRVVADDHVRDCMGRTAPVIERELLAASRRTADAAPARGVPGAIDVRFTYRRTASLDRRRFDDTVRLNLQEGGSFIDEHLAAQSASDGSPYFHYRYYPYPSARVVGVIAPAPLDSRLTSAQLPRAKLCLERPSRLPASVTEFDMFDCVEGADCKPSPQSTGWLRRCAVPISWWRELSPISVAHAQPMPERHWVTPSLDTLSARPETGVGYSYFKLRTEAFRRPDIRAVEVGLSVNGVPIDEDGLRPEERPAPNDPGAPYDYLFALETLDLQGAVGGCDRVSVSLTPRLADGSSGTARRFDLMYAALRDQPTRSERDGADQLQWSATVIRPVREWRHWAFVHSYGYRFGDEASRRAAVARVTADKQWMDTQRLVYGGAAIRGVVRPPLTVRNGQAFYGLAAGLLQPTGQIRFTFSEPDARTLGGWMVARRGVSAEAGRVIAPQPYLYQAPSGGVTPPGVCAAA